MKGAYRMATSDESAVANCGSIRRSPDAQRRADAPTQSLLELIFQGDAARCGEGSSLIDEFAGLGGEAQVAAGVAAVFRRRNAAGRSARLVEAAQ